ncbi:MAG TPA: feruloyl-CoA synthase [Thermoanaerobaculia bacterium]|jgi:feruloyl-CoA synthase|nr:feruloyl-CoA synthase [Thermoanaerobaculia bacterium]
MNKMPFKSLRLAPVDIETRSLPEGGLVLRSRHELQPYPRCLGELLHSWARAAPERTFLAERDANGDWRRVSYGSALEAVERIASALLERGLDRDRPVALLSDNGIDHGLLQLAAMQVGIPAVPVSPAYSLLAEDHAQLRYILELIRPGLVYAADGARFAKALATVAATGPVELVVSANPPSGPQAITATLFGALPATARHPALADRFAAVGPDTVAKILFTSGSTGKPKGVINTQRMLCSNQQALAQAWPFLEDRPPVIVDWLPWSHTFGGNHNFNLALRNGGTLYIDGGKPAPGLIETTVRNLREVPSTFYFNVPRGYEMLIPFLERDATLRETFFHDLDAIFYAAAALPQHLWEKLEKLSIAATGRRVVMLSAWGSTETAPSATQIHFLIERAGVIGLPGAGTEIKLAPVDGKLELRVKGPNVTPGYWQRPELTGEVFDEDGFLRTGDAGKLADPNDPAQGILFDGRLAENFKLTSGTWVHVGELRLEVIAACAPVVQDVVVTGHDREEVGLLVFPNPAGCRSVCGDVADIAEDMPLAELIRRPAVRDRLAAGLAAHNAVNRASSRRIARSLLLAEPPSIQAGEVTDKGYVNQRAVLARRAALVDQLYEGAPAPELILLDEER